MASEKDPLRSARLPSREQVIDLLDAEFARAGYEVEDVTINSSARPPKLTVIADGDRALDLDAVAELSRLASELLDGADRGDFAPYVLEVSSRGVDRPLTEAKHFRRAQGRKVELVLVDGSVRTGRVGPTADGALALVVRAGKDFEVLSIDIAQVSKAVVQVEFSPPHRRELELAGQAGQSEEEAAP